MDALERRQQRFLARLLRLEVRHVCRPSATSVGDGGPGEAWGVEQPLLGGSHERLRHELLCRGLQVHRFVRVPPNYYDTDLEARRACLQAHSVAHLCKTARALSRGAAAGASLTARDGRCRFALRTPPATADL